MTSLLSLSSTVRLSSGHAMPVLGLGVYQNYTAKQSCLDAFAAGYRHVDSAQAYRNEGHVGEAVREAGVPRNELFITTKIVSKHHGYDTTLVGVDESLSRFGFDYIDLFLIHDPLSGSERRLATYRALIDAQAKGKIRSVGVSNYGVHHLEEIAKADLPTPSVNQIELHPFCQQRPIVKYCVEHNIVVQAYCPLARAERLDHPVISAIASKHHVTSAQVLVRWSLQMGYVPLPKSVQADRIRENGDVFNFALDDEDLERLAALDEDAAGSVSWNPVDKP